jgi:YVTN family beta-propeller protein
MTRLPSGLLLLALAGILVVGVIISILRPWQQGAVVRTVIVGVFPSYIALDARTGHAFVANSLDASVSVLDDTDGAVLRTVPVGSNGGADPEDVALDSAIGRAYVTTDDGYLTLFNTLSGAILRSESLGATGDVLAIDPADGHLFVASADTGSVQMLNARTATPLLVRPSGTFPQALGIDATNHRLFVANSGDNTVSVLDDTNARELQKVRVGSSPDQVLVSAALHRVYIGNLRGGSITLLNADTGATVNTLMQPANTSSLDVPRLAVDARSNHLFIATGTRLDICDALTGQLVTRIQAVGRVTSMAMNPVSGHLLLALAGQTDPFGHLRGLGTLQARDARTGALLRSVQVGVSPGVIAVDPVRGRVLVVNTGMNDDGTLAHIAAAESAWPGALQWLRDRLPGLGRQQAPDPNGHGSVTVLNAAAL